MKNVFSRILLVLTGVCSLTISCSKSVEKNDGPPVPAEPVPGTTATFKVNVVTIAGKRGDHGNAEDGNGANARLWNPGKMVYDQRNKVLYVADGTTIRSIDEQ